jgi:hypothetical protein
MVLLVPCVKLDEQTSAARDPLVQIAMRMLGKFVRLQEPRVPVTARANTPHRDQRLVEAGQQSRVGHP